MIFQLLLNFRRTLFLTEGMPGGMLFFCARSFAPSICFELNKKRPLGAAVVCNVYWRNRGARGLASLLRKCLFLFCYPWDQRAVDAWLFLCEAEAFVQGGWPFEEAGRCVGNPDYLLMKGRLG